MKPDINGFSLLEVLIALLMISALFVAAHEGMSTGWRGVAAGRQERAALAIARRELRHAGMVKPVAAGLRYEGSDDMFSWSVSAEPAAGHTRAQDGIRALWVVVDVHWRDWHGPRHIRLKTVKLTE